MQQWIMRVDSYDDEIVVIPEWEEGGGASAPAAPVARTRSPAIPVLLLLAVVVALIVAGRSSTEDLAGPTTTTPPSTAATTSITISPPSSVPRTRSSTLFDSQVLGVGVGASLVSTDIAGRLFALDLDTGILTTSQVRTDNFVTVDGQLVVQNSCGAWHIIEVPAFTASENLIECGSYLPVDQRGAGSSLFAGPRSNGRQDVLVGDGDGGVLSTPLTFDGPSLAAAAVLGERVLTGRGSDEVIWIDPATGEIEEYASGRLLAAGTGAALWSNSCDDAGACRVWFGTPSDPQIHQFIIQPFGLDLPVRINPAGSRAVFFKADGVLRIITTETGHAREVVNPGVTAADATWTPDGLWLLQTSGTGIVALNTLNGRVVEFDGLPAQASPGSIALPRTS